MEQQRRAEKRRFQQYGFVAVVYSLLCWNIFTRRSVLMVGGIFFALLISHHGHGNFIFLRRQEEKKTSD